MPRFAQAFSNRSASGQSWVGGLVPPSRGASDSRGSRPSCFTPDIGFVFDDQRWVLADFESTLPDGTDGSGKVPVIDELGLIISKARSVVSPKRKRDAFDIALSVAQARDAGALRSAALDLEDRRSGTFSLLGNVWKALHDVEAKPSFQERVRRSI